MAARKRKLFAQLSPAYQRRLLRAGITPDSYATGHPLTAARGHAQTPEHPERASLPQNEHKYESYRARLAPGSQRRHRLADRIYGELITLAGRQKGRTKGGRRRYEVRFISPAHIEQNIDAMPDDMFRYAEKLDVQQWREYASLHNTVDTPGIDQWWTLSIATTAAWGMDGNNPFYYH